MNNQSLKKTTIIFFVWFFALLLQTEYWIYWYTEPQSFLDSLFVKINFDIFCFFNLRNEQKRFLIKKLQFFSLITIVLALIFSYSNTQKYN
jgi:preprotein translocase subunit SecG